MVLKRWAMMMTVLPTTSLRSASWMAASLSESSALVASSRMRMGRVAEEGAGEGDPLLLAAGEQHAALADHGVVALGEGRG